MSDLRLRYYQKGNSYYVELRDKEYSELDKRIRRINRNLRNMPGLNPGREAALRDKCAQLRSDRQKALKYIRLASSDVSEDMRARPMFKAPINVIELMGEAYDAVLSKLKKQCPERETEAKEAEA